MREFLKGLELDKETIDTIMAEHGKLLTASKERIEALKTDLAAAQETITSLEANKADAAAMQATIDQYKAAEDKREADTKAAQERAAIENRLDSVLDGKEFAHDYIRSGVLADFAKAVADPANTGKGDADVFAALTKDKEGIFKSQAAGFSMGNVKDSAGDIGASGILQTSKELNQHRLIQ